MSTVYVEHPAAEPTARTIFDRRGVLIAIAIGGVIAAIGAGLLLTSSDHLVDPIGFGLNHAVAVVGWFGAALYWLSRRRASRLGVVLLAVAICSAVMALQGVNQQQLHTIGVLADWLFVLFVFYVVFAFPEGRIESRVAWALLGATALERLATYVPSVLFSPAIYGNFPQAGCDAACPTNGFMIADRPTLADGLFSADTTTYIRLAVRSAICVYLLYRLARATRPRRRALLPVYVPVLVALTPILVLYLARLGFVHLDADTVSQLSWVGTIGISTLPYGFLVSVVLSALFAAAALKLIVTRLTPNPSAAELRTTLSDALDDPSLELGFRIDDSDGFVDSSGMPLVSTPPGQTSTVITHYGEIQGVIVHDRALDTDPELLAAAGQVLLLAIENGRLTAELQSTSTALRTTSARLVASGDAQRRKIERDLHDGAQQHLTALSIRVGLARELADPEAAQRLGDVGKELEEILEELRGLAHGLYPPLLREFGLRDAISGAARRSAATAKLETTSIGRYSDDVEAAVYFCCVESLQNVDKHAGLGATAIVRLWEHDGRLSFEVVDNGVGYDVAVRQAGQGQMNMSDRVAALGGTVRIESTGGRGTTIRADIPVSPTLPGKGLSPSPIPAPRITGG